MSYRTTSSPGYTLNLPGFTRAVKVLIALTCAVFVVQWASPSLDLLLQEWFALGANAVAHGQIWRLGSYLFLHAGLAHLFWNMLALWMFGVWVEEALGTQRFYQLYFVCGIGAGLVDTGFHLLLHSGLSVPTIGASGAIYGVLAATALLFPDRPVFLLLPPVTIQVKWLVLIYAALEFLFTLHSNDNVSHVAHLGGMLFAFLFLKGAPAMKLGSGYERWKRRRMQRRFEVYMSKRDRHTPPGGGYMH